MDVPMPASVVDSKVASKGVESTNSLLGEGGRPTPIDGEAKSGAFCRNAKIASELVSAGRE